MQYAIAEAVRQRLWIQNIDTEPQQIGKLHLNARRVEERGVASRVGSLSLSRSLSSISSSSLTEPKTLAVKKTNKTPVRERRLAEARMKEIQHADPR
ncbi:hypothetical protein [Halochromatium glycolicum]|uniref:hypothetical protein n=1 Tax=Halochromatium glycolicum TaxID=85075 RepID=UPI00190D5B5F